MIKTPCEGVRGGSRVSEKGMQRLKVMGEDYGHVSIFLQAEATVYVLGIKCLAPEWPRGRADYLDISQLLSRRVHGVLS